MPGHNHEAQVLLFQDRPEMPALLLRDTFGMDLPDFKQAHIGCGDSSVFAIKPAQADQVSVLYGEGDTKVMAIITEVQQGKDDEKPYTWPLYVAAIRERLKCPVHLLVISSDRKIAKWAGTPIGCVYDSLRLNVSVLGPDNAPVVVDIEQARQMPELSVLSTVMHSENHDVLDATQAALDAVPPERMRIYHKLIEAHLNQAAAQHWREQMQTEQYGWQSEIARPFIEEGCAKGRAEDVLRILDANGVDLTDDQRDTILACTDIGQLDSWFDRALKATTARDIFMY
ncbi:hypothetical protein [Streptomonospora litoralis]|uniref:Uncharacterized protein n=1 Tax=Streptomonospora litoralis TaxID=2498135 RepID=A0A4P6PVN1_9ACTN|nr:hypothetical protein [Streptomonospora litoralis]QBI52286.1 hypothetical protein EKD16_02350 [Streptomonospora litoralis]